MKKFNIILIILSIVTISMQAQKVILVPDEEIGVPTENPWGLTYHDGWFWVSDIENGNIIKFHRFADGISVIKAPRKNITGLTFEGDYLWVLADEWDTLSYPTFSSQKASLFKLNPETGEVLDTLMIPYYFWTGPKDTVIFADSMIFAEDRIAFYPYYRYLKGLTSLDSKLYVSYSGGWGNSLSEVDIATNRIKELCCAQPSGMETVEGEIWTITDYSWGIINADGTVSNGSDPDSGGQIIQPWPPEPVMRNSLLPLVIKDSLAWEDWERQLQFDLFASDLTWDGTNFWLLDPWGKTINRMVLDTIHPDPTIYCSEIQKVEVIPARPTVADDIKVVCHSMFTSGACAMTDYKVEIDGLSDPSNGAWGGIHVNAYHEVGMLTYMCESIDTIPIGKLNPGYHYLDYTLNVTNQNCVPMTQYMDFFVSDTTQFPATIEIIPEVPVAGEEVKIITRGICYLNTWFDLVENHITLYAYYNSCMMGPCGIDTISLGFLSEESYTLEYWLMDICMPFPADSLVYYDLMEFDVKGATGMDDELENEFTVYPIPATDKLFIDMDATARKTNVEIYNMTGQMVLREIFSNTSHFDLDVTGLTKGIYLLRLNTENNNYSTRIVIQ